MSEFVRTTVNITLIGMPGSGKSCIGEKLAKELGFGFVDPDKELERRYGTSLQEILEALGDEEFLAAEADMSIAAVERDDAIVLATGGSIVYSTESMQKLALRSRIVYLQVPLDVVQRRVGQTPRGIVGLSGNTLAQLYEERRPLYERWAAVTVDGAQSSECVVGDVVRGLTI